MVLNNDFTSYLNREEREVHAMILNNYFLHKPWREREAHAMILNDLASENQRRLTQRAWNYQEERGATDQSWIGLIDLFDRLGHRRLKSLSWWIQFTQVGLNSFGKCVILYASFSGPINTCKKIKGLSALIFFRISTLQGSAILAGSLPLKSRKSWFVT